MKNILPLLLIIFLPALSFAQKIDKEKVKTDSINIQQINLADGSVIYGYILEKVEKGIVVKTKMAGIINIEWEKITSINSEVKENKETGKVWFTNPHATRYFVGPSAIPLKKKEGYYQNTYILLSSFNVGITDHISIGAGFEILSLFSRNNPTFNFFLTPKIGYRIGNSNIHIGGGALHINMYQSEFENKRHRQNYNIFYGSLTIGNLDNNFTISSGMSLNNYTSFEYHETGPYDSNGNYIGYNYYTTTERVSEWSELPIITFSGMTRVSKKLSLITENWIIPNRYGNQDYTGLFSYGIRLLGDKTSFDFGFINNKDIASSIVIGIPYLDVVIKF